MKAIVGKINFASVPPIWIYEPQQDSNVVLKQIQQSALEVAESRRVNIQRAWNYRRRLRRATSRARRNGESRAQDKRSLMFFLDEARQKIAALTHEIEQLKAAPPTLKRCNCISPLHCIGHRRAAGEYCQGERDMGL
jgi:uncharacterized small protein (DUF1192 family)